MRTRGRGLAVLALLAGGCGHAHDARLDTTSPFSPAGAFCAAVASDTARALAELPADHPLRAAWRNVATCAASSGGAWGLSLDALSLAGSDVHGRWSLRHVRFRAGSPAREDVPFAPDAAEDGLARPLLPAGKNLEWSAERRLVPIALAAHDYDRDGDDEVAVVVETTDVHESGLAFSTRAGRVWTGRDGIALYPPARGLVVEGARGGSGDGRHDPITRGPYVGSATFACGSGDAYPVTGPALLAHALPDGSFSSTDAAAVAFARRDCPAEPVEPIVHDGNGYVDLAVSARNIACARLWGAATEPLLAAISAACRVPAGAACSPCDDAALLERWARLSPPLVVTPPR